ncbi:MAG: TonB-dependent receptor [Muribaculaceae bacterium]|nr:TonB-dependent receptor [Muribaculaceae bacterium]
MKTRLIHYLVLAVAMFAPATAWGAVINGILIDGDDTSPLPQATVRLLKANKDSTFVKALATDDNGLFNIRGVQPGKYYIKFSYIGYQDLVKHVSVGNDGRDVNMGVMQMHADGIMLAEAVVQGVKTPITVKEDTIEFNADTYKTQANAVVEDLLKRLPGVEVGSDGKITANGKSVTKILVDGKEFFGDDPTVASKNIPADMVNKLQVIDRKSDLARLTGVDDGEDETVINLTVKKGMNNGWFGSATAGYGTDKRYVANFIANYFREGNQFTLMGGANNTNNMGFSDAGASRFQRFGGDRGVTTSQNIGVNFNVGSKDDEHFRVGGDVMYSHSDRDTRQTSARQNIFPDSTSYRDAASAARDKSHNFSGNFRLKWEVDSFNTIDFRPNFSFNFSKSNRTDQSTTQAGDAARTLVNRSLSSYFNDGSSYEFGGSFVYNHNFRYHKGRSYSLFVRYNYSNVEEDGNTYTDNNYYLTGEEETIDQIYDNHRKTNSVRGRLSWTEPLGDAAKGRFLTLSYEGNYRYSRAVKSVYDILRTGVTPAPAPNRNATLYDLLRDPNMRRHLRSNYGDDALTDGLLLADIIDLELGDEISREFNERLSNSFRNKYFDQSFQVGFRKVTKEMNLNLGFSVNSAMSSSEDLINSARNIPSRWTWTVAPFARMRYKFSKTRNLALDYRMRASQPSLTQLQPVADESNPLNIVIGNPSLKPTFTHRINLRFNDFDQQSQRSIMAMIGTSIQQNSIITTITNNELTGGQTTSYTNINGVWDAMAMNMLSFPINKGKTFFYTHNFFARLAQTKGYSDEQYNRNISFNLNISPGIAFRNGVFDIELRPRYNFQTTHNTVQTRNDRNVHTYGAMFNGTYSAPFGLVLSTDLNFSNSSGYAAGYNARQWIWNASIAYQFLSERQASVQLSVYDILADRKNVMRNQTASYIEDIAYNSLGRYGMLTFTYKFTTFKKGEQPKDRNEEFRPGRWGGRPPGGGGGRPSGPPPGGPPRF